ncbi:hypothetical protein L486_03476 [Kwoniella mangroviensis CBS 10435]|uniref:Outer spore wall protein RRT8 n=1 Tax=Kwoniella mangroviensis CBS 10435 TaxID=1331196 RepID=A0A1B9ITV7_9TREE|nr:uncharacterized protein I203_02163 [Kwoniella mangroviensis CBS 8507]OCF58979.1 hypothetical protein L486_03476 [Kwoniella mangroviensis CBS 10435]OCF68773.1 hypothetical protein I203_02163 [Kwoniella mangroviensis CBS 8507]OCF76767.1 hypothetical protein I204_02469 [Kwoniella mangroviensis CBS 8886]
MSSSQGRKRQPSTGNAIAESVKRQVKEVGDTAQDAVISGAWGYPLYGIYYLVTHPALIRPLLPTLFKGVLVSVGVVAALFSFTYLPQVAVLAFVSGPLAFALAVPLVLGESYVVINFLTRALLVNQAGVDLFDAVLLQRGHLTLVEHGRQVTSGGSSGKSKVLGTLLMKPLSRFSTDNVVRYILTLPLNLIPVVGTVFFLGFNGFKSGPGYHARYFQLKGYDKVKKSELIKKRRGAYTAFGTMAMVLNLIPGLSILFTFTNAVGAALWASDLEKKGKTTASDLHDARKNGREDEVEVVLPNAGESSRRKDL